MAMLDTQLLTFFNATMRGYESAAKKQPEQVLDLALADRAVRLKLADAGLSPLALPLSHLCRKTESSGKGPDLEIFAWAGPSDWHPPAPPWDFDQLSWFGEIAGLESDRFSVNYTADHHLLCMYDRERQRAIFWLPDAASLPFWEWAAPFRILFHWWSQGFGGQICHAAAIGHGGRGALLVGRGGSGKSTTSIACVEAGMEFVGDDYVLLTRSPVPMAHSLYNSAKIHTKFLHSALAPWSNQVVRQIGPEQKSVLLLDQCAPEQVRRSLPIVGVFQPRITANSQAVIVPQNAAQGLLSMAPSTMYQLPEARQETLSLLAAWARSVPSFSLRLGTDLSSAPALLQQWLATEEVALAS